MHWTVSKFEEKCFGVEQGGRFVGAFRTQEDAERAVACVNACRELSTETLLLMDEHVFRTTAEAYALDVAISYLRQQGYDIPTEDLVKHGVILREARFMEGRFDR